jgi:catechol 2,3-dioxygenase-like lactoylglutathione lyase family enzyme
MPALSHAAVTVTDLAVSEAWYTRVFGVGPVLDELGVAHGELKDTGYGGRCPAGWFTLSDFASVTWPA